MPKRKRRKNPYKLPNIIGRKSKHPLVMYVLINIVFPPAAYFLLWKHHAPLPALAKFTIINSIFFITYFVFALYSFIGAAGAISKVDLFSHGNTLAETIVLTVLALFVTLTGIATSQWANHMDRRKTTETKRLIAILYGVLIFQYILGTSILFYMGRTAGSLLNPGILMLYK